MAEYGRIHTDGSRSGGQPVGTRQKAHTMILEVLAEWGLEPRSVTPKQLRVATTKALCRALDQLEDLRHDLERQMSIANEQVNEAERLRDALEAAPIISLWESKWDFRSRQDGWLKTKYRAALEQSK